MSRSITSKMSLKNKPFNSMVVMMHQCVTVVLDTNYFKLLFILSV